MSADNKAVVDKALETLKTSGVGTDKYNEALDSLVKAKNNEAATTLRKAQIYAEKYADNKAKAEEARLSSFYDVDEDGNKTGVKEELVKGYTENFNTLVDEDKAIIEREFGIDITSGTEEENLQNYINAVAERDYQTVVAQNADAATTAQVNKEITSAENKIAIEALTQTGATADEITAMDSTEADSTLWQNIMVMAMILSRNRLRDLVVSMDIKTERMTWLTPLLLPYQIMLP